VADPTDWHRSPGQGRYARPERERRFLVAEPPVLTAERTVEDRYLDGTTLRLRRVTDGSTTVHKLTQKVRERPDDPRTTRTTSTYLTAAEHALLAALAGADLVKTRGVPAGHPRWVVDCFAGPLDGLVLAEVEVADDEELALPAWLGREVTRDERFTGGALARTPAERLPDLLLDRSQDPLSPFVDGRRLRSLPSSKDRRWNVLAHVATHAFTTGEDYDEREVTRRLAEWCQGGSVDAVALRRYLVEEQLLSRGGGTYRLGSDGPPPSLGERLVRGMGLD
jgi:adenylate cyclase